MFSKELEVTISQAYQEARGARHEFLTVEHLLLALLDNGSALSILSACGADITGLEAELRKALQDTVPVLADEDNRDTQPTIGFQRVLQRALYHVQSAGKQEVIGANVLVAIFSEKESCCFFSIFLYIVKTDTSLNEEIPFFYYIAKLNDCMIPGNFAVEEKVVQQILFSIA